MQFILLLLSSVLFCNSFYTEIGECTIEIFDGKVDEIFDIKDLIITETEKIVNEFGSIDKRSFSIYITGSMKEFYEKSMGPTPEWGIAVAKNNPDKILIKSPGIANITYSRLKSVIIHELSHIYIFRITNYHTIPSWFKEGLAMRSSNEFSLSHKIEISNAQWLNRLLPLYELQNFSNYSQSLIQLAYGESAAAIEALEYYYGKKILNEILNVMNLDNNFKDAIEISINEKLLDFEIKYETYLKQNYTWLFLFRSPKYIYIILPIILTLGYIFHYYRNKKRL